MSEDIKALQDYYKDTNPAVAEKLGEAYELSKGDSGPDHVLGNLLSGIYSLPGLNRKTHFEEAEEVGSRVGEFDSFKESLDNLGLHYAASVGSGVKRLLQMADVHSPAGNFFQLNEETKAYYRRRPFKRNVWEARIGYVTADPYEEMDVSFSRDNDGVIVRSVVMEFKNRPSAPVSIKSRYAWNEHGSLIRARIQWGGVFWRGPSISVLKK